MFIFFKLALWKRLEDILWALTISPLVQCLIVQCLMYKLPPLGDATSPPLKLDFLETKPGSQATKYV
jgi:hypothetical protein